MLNRLISLATVVCLMVPMGSAICSAAPADVPRDHWAYEAVEVLADKGIVTGYPDGSFLGGRTLTRYEMAALVQRILTAVEAQIGDVRLNSDSTGTAPAGVSRQDLDTIKKLVDEFKVEMTVMGADLKAVQADVDQIKADLEIINESLEPMKAQVLDPEGALLTIQSDVSKMKKLKFSGYVQSRFEDHEGTSNSNFGVRRARLKAAAKFGTMTALTLQMDAAGSNRNRSVEVRDAYVEYFINGVPDYNPTITLGQQKWPFGFQILQSSGERETPERADFIRAMFPGERDRGVKISAPSMSRLYWEAGIFNGVGIDERGSATNPWYATSYNDNNKHKDIVGRIRYAVTDDWFVGASGYWGKAGPNNALQSKERFGADVQWTGLAIPLTLQAEMVYAKEPVGTTAATGSTVDQFGWYGQANYTFSPQWTGVYMYDMFKDGGVSNKMTQWNHQVGLIRWLDDKSRLKVFYQWKNEKENAVKNNQFTVEWITTY